MEKNNRRGKFKNTIYYVDGKELREELKKFKESNYKDYSLELCNMLKLMCERYSLRPNLISYTYREDMIENAFLRCLQQIHHIDLEHEKCNPFAYITKIIEHSMISTIKKENRQYQIAQRWGDKLYSDLSEEYNLEHLTDANNAKTKDQC